MNYFCCYCRNRLTKTSSGPTSWDPDHYKCLNCGAEAIHENNEEFEYCPPDLKFVKRPSNGNYTINERMMLDET